MQKGGRKKLGDILIAAGQINEEQLQKALDYQVKHKIALGKALKELGFVTEHDIIVALSDQLGIPYVSLSNYQLDPAVLSLVAENIARDNKLIPLFKIGNTLTVAMVDPLNVMILDELNRKTELEVEPSICTEDELNQTLDQYYGSKGTMDEMINIIEETDEKESEEEVADIAMSEEADAPIIKLVNLILVQSIKEKASDIHVEPDEEFLRVRYRVDGILREVFTQPKNLQNAIISRLKIMADLNIAEKRIPQDGRIQIKVENKDIDIRVSTIPTVNGENVVLRILDKSNVILNLEDLGLTPRNLKLLIALLKKPYGIIMVTGPTGSGKTTTLYSALSHLNSVDKNIITIEDPVEYRLGLIRQSQINPKAGLTFASGLRAFLRQDPDIIMVGEVRDAETANVAVQAALTGHLVLSTIHTNDAPGAVTRLVDMGVEPFLVSSSTAGIIAQRLIRRICPKCKEEYKPSESLLKELNIAYEGKKIMFFRGKGCRQCRDTGYKGRLAIFEILTLDDNIREMVLEKSSSIKIRNYALANGFKTLRHDGLLKALKGITSIEEIMRATQLD
ncbi:type II secretion system ATPase GspE [candidate division KSB1 bacterium]